MDHHFYQKKFQDVSQFLTWQIGNKNTPGFSCIYKTQLKSKKKRENKTHQNSYPRQILQHCALKISGSNGIITAGVLMGVL